MKTVLSVVRDHCYYGVMVLQHYNFILVFNLHYANNHEYIVQGFVTKPCYCNISSHHVSIY